MSTTLSHKFFDVRYDKKIYLLYMISKTGKPIAPAKLT